MCFSASCHHFRKAILQARNHRGKIPGAGRRVQCGAQPDEASNTLTRRPATHNPATDSRARLQSGCVTMFSGHLTGHCPATSRLLPGCYPDISADKPPDRRQHCHRLSGGQHAGWPPEVRRHCRRKSAGESADTESFAGEGVRLLMLKTGSHVICGCRFGEWKPAAI